MGKMQESAVAQEIGDMFDYGESAGRSLVGAFCIAGDGVLAID